MLLTNGCSFVWGDELEGYDTDPPSHHHLTFTHLLAQRLEMDYVNLGTCGASNQKIFRDTVAWLNDPDKENPTHMVIIWSAWQREEICENHTKEFDFERKIQRFQCMTQISPARVNNLKEDIRKPLDDLYDVYEVTRTGIIRTLPYMESIKILCESLGIKLIQGIFHELQYQNLLDMMHRQHRKGHWGEWMDWVAGSLKRLPKTSKVGMGYYQDLYSMARDKYTVKPYGHPDEDTQVEYANLLHHIFNTQWSE